MTIDFNGLLTKEDLEALENEAMPLSMRMCPFISGTPQRRSAGSFTIAAKGAFRLVRIVEIRAEISAPAAAPM